MNKTVILCDGVDYAFLALAYLWLAMWLFPDLAVALGVNTTLSAPKAMALLAALGLIRPWLHAKAVPARLRLMQAAQKARKKQ